MAKSAHVRSARLFAANNLKTQHMTGLHSDVRIDKLDTLKVVCLLCVIVGHTLNNSFGDAGQARIFFICRIFAMPMFAFISGWMSRPNVDFSKMVRRLLIPLIVFTAISDLVMWLVVPGYRLSALEPGFATWYLWALFVWRLSLPLMLRVPGVVLLSFVVSWAVGFLSFVGAVGSFSRIICFLPFFMLGYKVGHNVKFSAKSLQECKIGGYFVDICRCDRLSACKLLSLCAISFRLWLRLWSRWHSGVVVEDLYADFSNTLGLCSSETMSVFLFAPGRDGAADHEPISVACGDCAAMCVSCLPSIWRSIVER